MLRPHEFFVLQVAMHFCHFSRNTPSVLHLNKKLLSKCDVKRFISTETLLIFTFKFNIKHSFLNRNATLFSLWLVDTGLSNVKQAVMKHWKFRGDLVSLCSCGTFCCSITVPKCSTFRYAQSKQNHSAASIILNISCFYPRHISCTITTTEVKKF